MLATGGRHRGKAATRFRNAFSAKRFRSPLRVALALLLLVQPALAEDAFELTGGRSGIETASQTEPADDSADESTSAAEPETSTRSVAPPRGGMNAGIFGQVGHIAFPTFGRNDSISHVEVAPYVMVDDQMLFGDVRLFMSNVVEFGGNAGFGYRQYVPGLDRIFGVSGWYDGDNSTGSYFQQVSVGVETYGNIVDARGNLYVPIGETEQVFYDVIDGTTFVGNSVFFNRTQTTGFALTGFDFELGGQLPTRVGRDHDIRGYAGVYYFVGDGPADGITGFRGRLQGNLLPDVAGHVEVTSDSTFGTNVIFGFAWTFDSRLDPDEDAERTVRDRMGEFPRRNYNVIVAEIDNVQSGIEAVNPDTGLPYVVHHVSDTGGGTGTVDDPFTTIAAAQAAGGDVIFVHADTVLSETVTLQVGDRIFGDAPNMAHYIDVQGFGSVALPHATDGIARPTIFGAGGDALTLASDTVFSGFVIVSPTGDGIVGDGVENVIVAHTDVNTPGGRGIFLHDIDETLLFESVNITGAGSTALHIDGSSADIAFSGSLVNDTARSLLIENTTAGTIDLAEMSISDDGGGGILLHDVDGGVVLGDIDINSSLLHAIEIDGGGGTFLFKGITHVENAGGSGIRIQGLTGSVAFADADVTASAANRGVELLNNTGDVSFTVLDVTSDGGTGLFALGSDSVEIGDGTLQSTNASVVDIEDSTLDVRLTSVSSDNAAIGVRIVDSGGSFVVVGNGAAGTGGVIQNATTGILLDNAGVVGFQFLDLEDNGVGAQLTDVDEFYLARSRVTGTTDYGIDSLNTGLLQVANSQFSNNGGAGENSIRVQVDAFGSYSNQFLSNSITDANATNIAISSSGAGNGSTLLLTALSNQITNTGNGDSGILVNWSGPLVANFTGNTFSGTGGSNVGINLNTGSTAALADITVRQNTFNFTGGNDVAALLSTQAPAEIDVGWNSISLNGANSTGFEFSLSQAADVNVHSNLITDNGGAGTGMEFATVAGAADVTIEDNVIRLLGSGAIIDRGIIFSSVTGSVDLFGTLNNTVLNATTPFFAPVGSTTGQILINGVQVP